jgi:DNA replication protein DnaC
MMDAYTLDTNRERARSAARTDAADIVAARRPPWDDSNFWDKTCDGCGQERPLHPCRFLCPCEQDDARKVTEQLMEERRTAIACDIWNAAQVPRRYQDCDFEDFQPRPGTEAAVEGARAWAESFTLETEQGLFLAGPFGCGKTHLGAAAMYKAVEVSLAQASFVSAAGLVAKVRAGTYPDWTPVERAIREELVLLDDVGQQAGNDFTRDIILQLIHGRYDAARPTIFTTNMGVKALAQALGGGTVSRIHEMTQPLTLTAKDFRLHAGQTTT